MANKTVDIENYEEYERVLDSVNEAEYEEAYSQLQLNPRQFYAQLVTLLWGTVANKAHGLRYKEDSVWRDIFDTIQGIAARDEAYREEMLVSEED